ncbi:helix-turn-helix domain-containing protein [Gandjariella thermophila]|uniref:Transcriptional regulator n=1 Tax=Gandjariella thermophila TaxID=1931992 RepID=A0A4D4J3Y9_9PSEU|nr:helix-turn-helix transcriptional regulator [Gandjariella thermophila]GDY28683.1 transcriptional regulator [Gandjariella thermophila]
MDDQTHDIGRRLREIRHWRRKSLKVVAELAGLSQGHLSRLETGQRRLDKRSTIVALAAALDVAPSELIGQPLRWQDPAMAEAQVTIPALRLAVVGTELGDTGHGHTRPVADLRAEVDRCVSLRSACDFAAMGRLLPDLLVDLYATAAAARGDDRQQVLQLLIRTLNSAMTLAHAFGYTDLAYLVTERGVHVAEELRSPAWSAIAAFSRTHALLPIGGHTSAYVLASRAADQARSATGEANGDPALAAYGALCMVSALMAAVTGKIDESESRLAEAEAVAQRTGEAGPDVAFFGPTNVAIYRMNSALERGELDRAAVLADGVDPDRIASAERRAKYWLDSGRVLSALRGREGDAVAAFRRSEALAALRLRSNVYAREAVTDLLPRVRRDSAEGRELRGIAYRMGISG